MSILSDLFAKVRIVREHLTMEPRMRESLHRIDGKLRLLLDNQLDIRAVRPAEGRLRLRQEIELLILRILDVVAKRNGIPYWLMYGTLLGAIRHGGFVPWDDDLDIALLEDDYESFHSLLPSTLPESLEVQRWRSEEYPRLGIMRIVERDSRCFVDIYPHLRIPGALSDSNEPTGWEREYLRFMDTAIKPDGHKPLTDGERELFRKWIREHAAGDGNVDGIAVSPEYATVVPLYRKVFPVSDVLPLGSAVFEGFDFPVPANPTNVLERIYDTYNRFPGDAGVSHQAGETKDARLLRGCIDRLHSELDRLNKA